MISIFRCLLLGLLELRKRQLQHAVLVGRADSGGIHGPRQGKAAREGPECAFETVGVFLRELHLPLALATEHQRVVLDTGLDLPEHLPSVAADRRKPESVDN
jgi:hypothetical protein